MLVSQHTFAISNRRRESSCGAAPVKLGRREPLVPSFTHETIRPGVVKAERSIVWAAWKRVML